MADSAPHDPETSALAPLAEPRLPESYRLISVLGRGSFGQVYLAEDIKTGEKVALKEFIPLDVEDASFIREMAQIFNVQHEFVISCLSVEYGVHGRNYLVLEYAEGGNLRQLLREKQTIEDRLLRRILRHIAEGLAALHQAGIIHCDLKPENILVFPRRGDLNDPQFKITDFGISQLAGVLKDESESATGSPAYMAPEQFHRQPVFATDLYALGIILYECYTGERPFSGDSMKLYGHHLNDDPDLSKIDDPWKNLIGRLLEKTPVQRWPNADAMLHELRAQTTSEAVLDPASVSALFSLELPERTEKMSGGTSAHGKENFSGESGAPRDEVPFFLELEKTVRLGGLREMIAPNPWVHDIIYLGDNEYTARLQAASGRLQPQYFMRPCTASSIATMPERESYFCVGEIIYRSSAENEAAEFFAPKLRVQALAARPRDGIILCLGSKELVAFDEAGNHLWTRPAPSYAVPPRILILPGGVTAFAPGPHRRCVQFLDRQGQLIQEVTLHGPVLLLANVAAEDAPGEVWCLEASLRPEEGPRLLTLSSSGGPPRLVRQLSRGFDRGFLHPGGLFTIVNDDDGGHATCHNLQGEKLWENRLEDGQGTVQGALYLPVSGRYFLLVKQELDTVVHAFQVRSPDELLLRKVEVHG